MAREKRTKLWPWQKEIPKGEYEKELLAGSRQVGRNSNLDKYYRVDYNHPEYLKYRADKTARKKARFKKAIDRAKAIAFKKGVRQGMKDFLKSERLTKIKDIALRKGIKAAKPKQNTAERLARKEAKLKTQLKELEAKKAKLAKA